VVKYIEKEKEQKGEEKKERANEAEKPRRGADVNRRIRNLDI